jgi:DNA polymerase (family 10)
VDNRAVARILAEIADLLEIKGDNAFKIRAYRSAADTVATWPDALARLDERALRELPGIGKDLAARIHELTTTGASPVHDALRAELPPTILELLRLQGVGPKTVATLHSALGVASLDDLAAAARAGRLRTLKGMGAKKEAQILEAIAARSRETGRHLLTDTAVVAANVIGHLRRHDADADLTPVGSLRRGTETCGDLDIVATGTDLTLMDAFVAHPDVERVLGQGETRSSVLLRGGHQVDLRLVPASSRGAALQYFTGSKAHNIALRDRAVQQGLRLNEYGLFREDGSVVAGETEDGIYDALGLPWIAPELREQRGEIEAALSGELPRLIDLEDLRGDLHMHTTESDGRDDLETMADAASRLGHQYIAVTDHSKALAMANGLDETRALAHAARVRALNGRFGHLTLLAGNECDIRPDGRLDLADDCLAQLDIVIASVHSHFSQDDRQMTDRLLRAIECPWVDVLGHPTGRLLLRRDPQRFDLPAVIEAAAREGVALEINSQPHRLDLGDTRARLAREGGVPLVVSSDAHAIAGLEGLRWGVQVARRAWAAAGDVLNTRDLDDMVRRLRRHRRR